MSTTKRTMFWIAVLAAAVGLLVLLSDILLPFVAGMALAYFLDPAVDRLETRRLSRTLATTVVLLAFFVLLLAALLLFVPLVQGQLVGLVRQLPDILMSVGEGVGGALEQVSARLEPEQVKELQAAVADLQKEAAGWLLGAIQGLWSSGIAVLNLFGLLIITPVVAWYLLRDWDNMVERVDGWLPRDHAETIRTQVRLIDRTLAGFVRGQALVCLILGIAYAIGLQLAGLHYGLVVGLLAGLISFVPFVGSIVGLALSLGLGYAQFGLSPQLIVLAVIFFAGQVVEGNYLTPKLVGNRVGLQAVWVVFALLAGGSLFGFVGVLIAVPVAAVIGVLVRFALDCYLKGSLYRGAGGDGNAS